ncbi:MAG: PIN domain-containing protein [Myxococcales bacterium]|nr:PIN domain-containing protein [Myxococcales bacterium]
MTLADSNFWLAATLSKHVFHEATRAWLEGETRSAEVLFCRLTQLSYLRLLTTAAVLAPYGIPPLTNAKAWSTYEGWRADDRISFIDEPRGMEAHWKRVAARTSASPKAWMDGYLAALAMTGGHRLITTDRGFRQYKGLDVLVLPSRLG